MRTDGGYLRTVLADGTRPFRYRPGVARLLGHVDDDMSLVFLTAPVALSFPYLRRGDAPRTAAARATTWTGVEPPRQQHQPSTAAGRHDHGGDRVAPSPDIPARREGMPTASAAADPPDDQGSPVPARLGGAGPAPERQEIVVPAAVTVPPPPAEPPTAHGVARRAAAVTAPPAGPLQRPQPAQPGVAETVAVSGREVRPPNQHDPGADPWPQPAWAGEPRTSPPPSPRHAAAVVPATEVPRAAGPLTASVPQPVPSPVGDVEPLSEGWPAGVADTDAEPVRLPRPPAAVVPDRAEVPSDGVAWWPATEDRVQATAPPPAVSAPSADDLPVVIEDVAPYGVTGFWARRYVGRRRPRLLR